MGDNKVQGEGDYESARHYSKDTEDFVEEHGKDGKPIRGDASQASDTLTPEEREGRAHAKRPGQDQRDAEFMETLERKKES